MLEIETLNAEQLKEITNPWYRAFLQAHSNRRYVASNLAYIEWLADMKKLFLQQAKGFVPGKAPSWCGQDSSDALVGDGRTIRLRDCNCVGYLYYREEFTAWLAEEVKQPSCYRLAELLPAAESNTA